MTFSKVIDSINLYGIVAAVCCFLCYFMAHEHYPTGYPGWWTCGGGGGGQGYANGGGGGGGGTANGEYNPVSYLAFWDSHFRGPGFGSPGVGGTPGADGSAAVPKSTTNTYNDETAVGGDPGLASGQGGAAGKGSDNRRKASEGADGGAAGARVSAGMITIKAGSVKAQSGGGDSSTGVGNGAQDIGSGGGSGEASGSLVIRGGNVPDSGTNMLTPTNGVEQVYAVLIRPYRYVAAADQSVRTEVTVDDADWGVSRFFPDVEDGTITIWLPDESVYRASVSLPVQSDFEIELINGNAAVKATGEISTYLDLADGDIVFGNNTYSQNGSSGFVDNNTATVTGTGNQISFQQNMTGTYTLVMDTVNLSVLNVSPDYGTRRKVVVQSVGTENHISRVNLYNADSEIEFTGDSDSVLDIDKIYGNENSYNAMNCTGVTYLTDLEIAGIMRNNSAAQESVKAKLEADGYTVAGESIKDESSYCLYLGYKESRSEKGDQYSAVPDDLGTISENAILDIRGIKGDPDDLTEQYTASYPSKYGIYELLTASVVDTMVGVTLPIMDLNTFSRDDEAIFLYCLRLKNVNREAWKQDYGREPEESLVTNVWVYRGDLPYGDVKGCGCHTEFVKEYFGGTYDNRPRLALNNFNECGQLSTEIGFSRAKIGMTVNGTDAVPQKQQAGSICMNSRGIVNVGEIYSDGVPGGKVYGTPDITVNSGLLSINTYAGIHGAEGLNFKPSSIVTGQGETDQFYNTCSTGIHTSGKYMRYYYHAFFGDNTFGDVNVTGGTLEIGESGSGNFQAPEEYSNMTAPKVKVSTGGNLLCGDTEADPDRIRVEITGLPQNAHLTSIPWSTDETEIIGDCDNKDIWTNENGNFVTYVAETAAGRPTRSDICFVDAEGNAYVYRIVVSGDHVTVTKDPDDLWNEITDINEDEPIHFYKNYAVQGSKLYRWSPEHSLDLQADRKNVIKVMENATARLNAAAGESYTIPEITGEGSVELTGDSENPAAVTVSGKLDTKEVTVSGVSLETAKITGKAILDSGRVNTDSISDGLEIREGTVIAKVVAGDVIIKGGSVQTDTPIQGATNGSAPVYQTAVPVWDSSVKVDDKVYPGVDKSSQGNGKMYLYLPATAQTLEADGHFYYLSLNEKTRIMELKERENGDGTIDLSVSSAEILDDDLYQYDGKIYRNTNGGKYTITGKTDGNTLTISGGEPEVTLKNLTVNSTEGNPIDIESGVKVILFLEGESVLTAGRGLAAVHVPEDASAEIRNKSKGILTTSGGEYAAAIGGSQGEKNGNIVMTHGTYNLYGQSCVAVGAGAGETTPQGSIDTGNSSVKAVNSLGGSGLGTTPVSGGQPVTLLVFTPEKFSTPVLVDNQEWPVEAPNDDGRLYLYLISQKTDLQVGGVPYTAVPVWIKDTEHGEIVATREDENDSQQQLKNGEMVLEGDMIHLDTSPDDGYGLKTGPASGDYEVRDDGQGNTILYPRDDLGSVVSGLEDWEVLEQTGDEDKNTTAIVGFTKELTNEEAVVDLGIAGKGTAVTGFVDSGKGIRAELLIDGEPVEIIDLKDKSQRISYEWEADGTERVLIRFSGSGNVVLETLFLGNTTKVSDITAEFAPVFTLTLEQPKGSKEESMGVIRAFDDQNRNVWDRNGNMDGIQLLENETVTLVYLDYDGGSVFDNFILTYSGGTDTVENNYLLTMTRDVTVSAQSHLDLYYEVNIPETVALDDAGTSEKISVSTLKNLEADEVLSVSVTGTDEQGRATLIRKNTDDVLYVPVTNSSNLPFVPNTILLQYKLDENHKPVLSYGDGKVNFGAPQGTKKAGEYAGSITFSITCEEEKGNP